MNDSYLSGYEFAVAWLAAHPQTYGTGIKPVRIAVLEAAQKHPTEPYGSPWHVVESGMMDAISDDAWAAQL